MKRFIQAETPKTFHKSNFSKSWSTLLFFFMVVTTNSDTILVSCFDSIQSCSGYTDLYRAIQIYTELQTYKELYRHTQSCTDLCRTIQTYTDVYRVALAIQRCYITSLDLSTKFVAIWLWCNPYSRYLPDFFFWRIFSVSQFFLRIFITLCVTRTLWFSFSLSTSEYHSAICPTSHWSYIKVF